MFRPSDLKLIVYKITVIFRDSWIIFLFMDKGNAYATPVRCRQKTR